jgi:hypothetical protein
MHAANNAVGHALLSVGALNSQAAFMARVMAEAEVPLGSSPPEFTAAERRFRKALTGPQGGMWTPEVILSALAARGYRAHRREAAEFSFDAGPWLIWGRRKGSFPAPVAVRGTFWLDSAKSAPEWIMDGCVPSDFTPHFFYELEKVNRVDSAQSNLKASENKSAGSSIND